LTAGVLSAFASFQRESAPREVKRVAKRRSGVSDREQDPVGQRVVELYSNSRTYPYVYEATAVLIFLSKYAMIVLRNKGSSGGRFREA